MIFSQALAADISTRLVQAGEEVPSVLGLGEKFPRFSLTANVGVQQETAFTILTDQDLRGFWKLYFFWPKDFTALALTELHAFAALEYELSELQARCVGASVESEYAHLAWRRQEPELKDYPFPLLADTKRELCGELMTRSSSCTFSAWKFHAMP